VRAISINLILDDQPLSKVELHAKAVVETTPGMVELNDIDLVGYTIYRIFVDPSVSQISICGRRTK